MNIMKTNFEYLQTVENLQKLSSIIKQWHMFGAINPFPTPSFGPQQPLMPQPIAMPQPITIDGKQVHPMAVQQLKQLIDIANQLQLDSNLQNLLLLLKIQGQRSIETMQRASSFDWSKKQSQTMTRQEQVERVRDRCGRIKGKNQQLLVRMLNLREKLVSQMNMYRSRSQARELEMGQISQKIRDIKCEISYKYNRLRSLRMSRERENKYKQKQSPRAVESVVSIPLVELKKGAEVLERESLKLREQLSLVQRFMHGEAIV